MTDPRVTDPNVTGPSVTDLRDQDPLKRSGHRFDQQHGMCIDTAVGQLVVVATDTHIIRVTWAGTGPETGVGVVASSLPSQLLQEAARQLHEYADGERTEFDLPLHMVGSDFQKAVWREMLAIPYAETKTYGDLAKNLNSAARAVGRACGSNNIPIIIPCHRVMGQNGKLTGFSGGDGVVTKQHLLALERRWAPPATPDLPLFSAQN
ncbi:MAG: methylated-DNA--[protein]-cysteine S-methyltransferase [Alphaproteobacteria bacterium]